MNPIDRNPHPNLNQDKERSFLSALSPVLEYSSKYDSELNRRLAHEFNVFDFLRDDELGLSRIIAHLLDPKESHGQGTYFLRHFLNLVRDDENNWNYLNSKDVIVETEHVTDKNYRIDIYVKISGGKPFVLAIENKPYARDLENQVLEYLKYLDEGTDDYLLVYLSSDGRGPSELSFPIKKRHRWTGKFSVMAYAGENSDESEAIESEFFDARQEQEVQKIESLATWFNVCKEKCEIDRLRWFLSDAEDFCIRNFGSDKSTNDMGVKIVEEFLIANRGFVDAAYKVTLAWPEFVRTVTNLFMNHLTDRISHAFSCRNDLEIFCDSDFNSDPGRRGKIYISLYSCNWTNHDDGWSASDGRYCIELCSDLKNKPDWWYVGVRSPVKFNDMSDDQKSCYERIVDQLKTEGRQSRDGYNPAYKYVDDKFRNWEPMMSDLLEEIERGEGEITNYFVDRFVNFAETALEILDDVETANDSTD